VVVSDCPSFDNQFDNLAGQHRVHQAGVVAQSRRSAGRSKAHAPFVDCSRRADQREPIPMTITYSESHPTTTRIGTTTDHLTRVVFIARSDFSGPTKKRKHPNVAPGTRM
jgi:hypothetical protein